MMRWTPWSAERIARVERGIAAGETFVSIAAALGLSETPVRDKAAALGLYIKNHKTAPSFWTSENTAMLKAYVIAGMPYSEIAELLGCTKNAAIGKARRIGIADESPNTKPRGPEPKTTLERLGVLDVFPSVGRCVYPIGEPRRGGFHFCAAKTDGIAHSYCTEHDKLCHPSAASEALREAWANDPNRHLQAMVNARKRGLAKMGLAARKMA